MGNLVDAFVEIVVVNWKSKNFILVLVAAFSSTEWTAAEEIAEYSVPLRQTSPSPADSPAWRYVTGIPIPRGMLDNAKHAKLVDANGTEIPAQFEALAHWSPARDSVKWLRVAFTSPAMIAQAPKYQLLLGRGVRAAVRLNPIQITHDDTSLSVTTGPLRFTLDKKRGGILSGVSRFGRKVYNAASTDGPYVEDDTGAIYRAAFDERPNVVIEESGPVRVVVRVESWHVRDLSSGTTPFSPAGVRLNKSITRYYAYAGIPCIEVDWTFVITADTEFVRFKDIGLRLSGSREARVGLENEKDIELADGYLLQKKHDQFVVRQLRGSTFANLASGTKATGWFSTKNLAVTMRDFWQTFPKELEVSQSTLIIHAWPGHGEYNSDWFVEPKESPSTDIAPQEIVGANGVKLNPAYFSLQQKWHHGPMLDFRYPDWWRQPNVAFMTDDRAREDSSIERVPESQILHPTATGASRTQQLLLDFSGESTDRIAARRALFLAQPHVWVRNPQWLSDSCALGPMDLNAADSWDGASLENWGAIGRAGYFGMWIWGNMPEAIDTTGLPCCTRQINGAARHGFFHTHWLLYGCTGRAAHLQFARANTAHWRDIGLVHYATSAFEKRTDGNANILGGANAASFYPWRSGVQSMSDSGVFPLLMDFYLTGDRRSLAAADLHARALFGASVFTGAMGKTALDWYAHGWDPEWAKKIDEGVRWMTKQVTTSSKTAEASPLQWQNFAAQYLDLTRHLDNPLKQRAEVLAAVKKWSEPWIGKPLDEAGPTANPGTLLAAAWFATSDPRYVRPFARNTRKQKLPRDQWLKPEPPGFGSGADGASNFNQVLYSYAAWRQVMNQGLVGSNDESFPK